MTSWLLSYGDITGFLYRDIFLWRLADAQLETEYFPAEYDSNRAGKQNQMSGGGKKMKREEQFINNVKYADVTRAISRDITRMFCVNTDNDVFVEFIPHEQDEELDIRAIGDDFREIVVSFWDSAYPSDADTVRTAFTKQNILNVLSVDDSFSLNYRMMSDGKPVYVRLKAVRLQKEESTHILIALSNTDAHMQRMAIYERAMNKQLTFTAISEALALDYDCIFYVNTQSHEFVEYSSSEAYKELGFDPAGDDFFELCRNKFSHLVFEEDRDIFLQAMKKENLLKVLSVDRLFLLTFRVVFGNKPIYVRVKITKMTQIDDHHIVVGLTNIDANMQRIQQYEQMKAIADKDSLTGVRSKHAYTVEQERIDREIEQGGAEPFAVVVCDVNGLKKINDTKGHQAGDAYLCRSCRMICDIFQHSPVFRVGGDEFVVLLTDRDYEIREELMKELHDRSEVHIGSDEAVVSGGLAEYNPKQDRCMRDVFERADAMMYKEKMMLKSLGAVTRDDESAKPDTDKENIPIINMRKHLLIADDHETNREILGSLLEEDYDILYASDGVETMEMLRKHKDEIALLLLDLYMPHMTGREVIKQMHVDEELMSIPVIMLTVDQEAELDSLRIGAMDFISKPYPDINIVKARIAKCIELSENRDLIQHTQRDKLTGLLHFDYFIRYAERFDHQYKDAAFDAFVCDIKQFRAVNEQYGRQFGDLVLRSIGSNIRKLARKTGGIGCRQGGDTFMVYLPHQADYDQLIRRFQKDLFLEKETADKVKLRFGVFVNAERESDVEKRFACAKAAADSIADSSDVLCRFYEGV